MELDAIMTLLGLNLPKVYAVNRVTEWVQEEFKSLGYWEQIADFAVAIPFVVAMALSSFGENACADVIQSGLIYGAAAMALHYVTKPAEDQPP